MAVVAAQAKAREAGIDPLLPPEASRKAADGALRDGPAAFRRPPASAPAKRPAAKKERRDHGSRLL